MTDPSPIGAIAPQFRIEGRLVRAERYGTGHINETFLGHYDNGAGVRRFIHQRINERVFPDVPSLMSNIGRVTRHVNAKLGVALELVPTIEGGDLLHTGDGSWWRTYVFIEGARTYDTIDRPEQAYHAARAFGRFAYALTDLEGPRLHETIPAFHDTNRRYAALVRAVQEDAHNRAAQVRAEIEFCEKNVWLADALPALVRNGVARECVTHNDTKLNNVMLDDRTGTGVCVIDLDTVMPGLALYDFGDMVRTATMPVAEDERDLSLVHVNAQMFEALARGFTEGAGALVSAAEREHFVTAGKVMTFECGIRFLTDHLAGDKYFRIHRPGQNLDRARTQFALVESLHVHQQALQRSITELH